MPGAYLILGASFGFSFQPEPGLHNGFLLLRGQSLPRKQGFNGGQRRRDGGFDGSISLHQKKKLFQVIYSLLGLRISR